MSDNFYVDLSKEFEEWDSIPKNAAQAADYEMWLEVNLITERRETASLRDELVHELEAKDKRIAQLEENLKKSTAYSGKAREHILELEAENDKVKYEYDRDLSACVFKISALEEKVERLQELENNDSK